MIIFALQLTLAIFPSWYKDLPIMYNYLIMTNCNSYNTVIHADVKCLYKCYLLFEVMKVYWCNNGDVIYGPIPLID